MKTNLIKTLLFFICIFISCASAGMSVRVYLKNTGNETVYVALATAKWEGSYLSPDWEKSYVGWYELEPGDEKFYASLEDTQTRLAFAFQKRGGYVVYKRDGSAPPWADEFYVDPENEFNYSGSPKKSYVPIKASFGARVRSFGDYETTYYTIEVPSYKSDKVIPLVEKKSKASAQPTPSKTWKKWSRTSEQPKPLKKKKVVFNNKCDFPVKFALRHLKPGLTYHSVISTLFPENWITNYWYSVDAQSKSRYLEAESSRMVLSDPVVFIYVENDFPCQKGIDNSEHTATVQGQRVCFRKTTMVVNKYDDYEIVWTCDQQ